MWRTAFAALCFCHTQAHCLELMLASSAHDANELSLLWFCRCSQPCHTVLPYRPPSLVASGSHVAFWFAAEVLTAQSSEHSFHSELSDLMSARQEWHATLDDVLEGTHDDLEAIMISARYSATDSPVLMPPACPALPLCLLA